jgi:hypothetical protein
MSLPLEEQKPRGIEMVENVDAGTVAAGFKDEHHAVIAAATVPVGGVYLTKEELKMVRTSISEKSKLTRLVAPQGKYQVRLLCALPLDIHVSLQRT